MRSRVVIAALCLLTPPWGGAHAQTENYRLLWDARNAPLGQLAIYNADANGAAFGMPVAAGNLNGPDSDGIIREDVVLAPFNANAGPVNSRRSAGKLHIYFGQTVIGGTIVDPDAGAAPGSVEVWGAREGDFLGAEVDVADVTGDGLEDVLACVQNADGFGASVDRTNAGSLAILLGRDVWPSTIDLADTASDSGVIEILGIRASLGGTLPGDRLGFWVTGGDVTGDGIADILVSADMGDGPGDVGQDRGELYIIPGGANLLDANGRVRRTIDLANPMNTLVFTIYGADNFDNLGSAIASADFDGDGIGDIAVSAGFARLGAQYSGPGQPSGAGNGGGDGPNNDRDEAGEVYIVFGRSLADWRQTPVVELTNPPADDVSVYYGQRETDYFGEDVAAGDFDGDGRPELVVGALLADAPDGTGSRRNSGIGYVFWGSSLRRGEAVDLLALGPSPRVTRLSGEFSNDIGADSIRLADIDNDGRDDLLYGSPNNPGSGTGAASRPGAGDLKVIFGMASGLPPIVDLALPPASVTVFQIVAPDAGDMFTYSLAVGDYDGDRYLDLIPNAMAGDGNNNQRPQAGDAFVISGRVFSQLAGRQPGPGPAVTDFRASPGDGPYYAGAPGLVITLVGQGFEAGAEVLIAGMMVPDAAIEVVSPTELRISLDRAPAVLTMPGPVVVQVRNPDGGISTTIETITLVGPVVTSVKLKLNVNILALKVRGMHFLPGATVLVTGTDGGVIPLQSVERTRAQRFRVTIRRTDAPAGTMLDVRVVNPGPVASEPRAVMVP